MYQPFGALLYGFVFEHTGSRTYLPFYVAGLLMLAITFFARRVFRSMGEAKNLKAEDLLPLNKR